MTHLKYRSLLYLLTQKFSIWLTYISSVALLKAMLYFWLLLKRLHSSLPSLIILNLSILNCLFQFAPQHLPVLHSSDIFFNRHLDVYIEMSQWIDNFIFFRNIYPNLLYTMYSCAVRISLSEYFWIIKVRFDITLVV